MNVDLDLKLYIIEIKWEFLYTIFVFQFELFYNKQFNGRKLTWMHSFCNGKENIVILCLLNLNEGSIAQTEQYDPNFSVTN